MTNEKNNGVRYEYNDECGSTYDLAATDMDAAIKEAREYCRQGDWGSQGALVEGRVIEYDADGNETDGRDIQVTIEPDHKALIREAGGDTDCDHEWVGQTTCSLGGTTLVHADHCRKCGLQRVETYYGSRRDPGQADKVVYEQPRDWCETCQSPDCTCGADDDADE